MVECWLSDDCSKIQSLSTKSIQVNYEIVNLCIRKGDHLSWSNLVKLVLYYLWHNFMCEKS